MLRLGLLVGVLLAAAIANGKNPCLRTCKCNIMNTERCKEGQVVVDGCKCCYYCQPAHLRCMGLGPACSPVKCQGNYCWCFNPINNRRVGLLLPYRTEYAYVSICEDLWYFYHLHQLRKSTAAKVNIQNNGLKSQGSSRSLKTDLEIKNNYFSRDLSNATPSTAHSRAKITISQLSTFENLRQAVHSINNSSQNTSTTRKEATRSLNSLVQTNNSSNSYSRVLPKGENSSGCGSSNGIGDGTSIERPILSSHGCQFTESIDQFNLSSTRSVYPEVGPSNKQPPEISKGTLDYSGITNSKEKPRKSSSNYSKIFSSYPISWLTDKILTTLSKNFNLVDKSPTNETGNVTNWKTNSTNFPSTNSTISLSKAINSSGSYSGNQIPVGPTYRFCDKLLDFLLGLNRTRRTPRFPVQVANINNLETKSTNFKNSNSKQAVSFHPKSTAHLEKTSNKSINTSASPIEENAKQDNHLFEAARTHLDMSNVSNTSSNVGRHSVSSNPDSVEKWIPHSSLTISRPLVGSFSKSKKVQNKKRVQNNKIKNKLINSFIPESNFSMSFKDKIGRYTVNFADSETEYFNGLSIHTNPPIDMLNSISQTEHGRKSSSVVSKMDTSSASNPPRISVGGRRPMRPRAGRPVRPTAREFLTHATPAAETTTASTRTKNGYDRSCLKDCTVHFTTGLSTAPNKKLSTQFIPKSIHTFLNFRKYLYFNTTRQVLRSQALSFTNFETESHEKGKASSSNHFVNYTSVNIATYQDANSKTKPWHISANYHISNITMGVLNGSTVTCSQISFVDFFHSYSLSSLCISLKNYTQIPLLKSFAMNSLSEIGNQSLLTNYSFMEEKYKSHERIEYENK